MHAAKKQAPQSHLRETITTYR